MIRTIWLVSVLVVTVVICALTARAADDCLVTVGKKSSIDISGCTCPSPGSADGGTTPKYDSVSQLYDAWRTSRGECPNLDSAAWKLTASADPTVWPEPILAREEKALFWRMPRGLAARVDGGRCSWDGPASKGDCTARLVDGGIELAFAGPAPTKGEIKVGAVGDATLKGTIRQPQQCTAVPAFVVVGAERQELELHCALPDVQRLRAVTDANQAIEIATRAVPPPRGAENGNTSPNPLGSGATWLQVVQATSSISANVGPLNFDILDSNGVAVGTVRLRILASALRGEPAAVRRVYANDHLQRVSDSVERPKDSGRDAAVNPLPGREKKAFAAFNTTMVRLAPELEQLADDGWNWCWVAPHRDIFLVRPADSTARQGNSLGAAAAQAQATRSMLRENDDVAFAVYAPQDQDVTLGLELRKDSTCRTENLPARMRLVIPVAKRAVMASLPFPGANAVYIKCGAQSEPPEKDRVKPGRVGSVDYVTNGTTKAIDDSAADTGQCTLIYTTATAQHRNASMLLYGPQRLEIAVTRGEQTQRAVLHIKDVGSSEEIPLPIPKNASGSGEYYLVEAVFVPEGPGAPATVPGSNDESGTPEATSSSTRFSARLRRRGYMAWSSAPLRTFVTFPLQFTGYRFPASPIDLKRSSDRTNAQTVGPRAGILVGAEPWNYDTGKSLWAIPLRGLVGMNLYDLGSGTFQPSVLVGGSVTFPIIDPPGQTASQLGTDVAISTFWECDLRQDSPLKHGNHFLVTFGLNVLSVFGSK